MGVRGVTITAPCASNSVSAGDFLEADGAGAVKAFDGTGTPLGMAQSNKDANNNVGCIKLGLVKAPTSAASFNFGDELEWATGHKVAAKTTGVTVGYAAETKTTTSSDNDLLVYINMV